MLATAPEMDENTMGTTIQNIRLMKMVPRGLNIVAPGHTAPTIHPKMIAHTIAMRRP
jgi:hypothetical protein